MIPEAMDHIDMSILEALQDDIPLAARPYAAIASRLGIPETEILTRLKKMHEAGIIRGISPVLESRHMGLAAATLVALHVPEEKIISTAAIISSFREVWLILRGDLYYSMWFWISAGNEELFGGVVSEILDRTGILGNNILNLPTVKKIKIDVRFSFVPPRKEEN